MKEERLMLVPSIFNTNFTDDFFNGSFDHLFQDAFHSPFERRNTASYMSTDIQDLGDSYQMDMELPGYEKEDLKADLKDGYLTISAEHTGSQGALCRKLPEKVLCGKKCNPGRYPGEI